MLATGGLDQAIDRVVSVFGARLDSPVAEVDSLLGVVANVRNIARRIIGVINILQTARLVGRRWIGSGKTRWLAATVVGKGRASPRVELDQTKRFRIILVARAGAVFVVNALVLTFGVVVDV